jgi:DNA repair protein RadC
MRDNPVRGVRPQKVISIVERAAELPTDVTVDKSADLIIALQDYIGRRSSEVMIIVYLDTVDRIIGYQELTVGSPVRVEFSWHGIFKEAFLRNAVGMIMVHQHPSGNWRPSPADNKTYQQGSLLCAALDIAFIDFIVLGEHEYYSAKDAEQGVMSTSYARLKIARRLP